MKSIGFKRLTLGLGVLTAAVTTLSVITSCDSEAIVDAPAGRPIQVTTTIGAPVTRTVSTTLNGGTKFAEGTEIRCIVTNPRATTSTITTPFPRTLHNAVYTLEGENGSFSTNYNLQYTTGTTDVIYIWGIYPSACTMASNGSTAQSFSVQTEQNLESNYLASDLMMATPVVVSYASPAATLNFQHKLAKVIVNLDSTEGAFGYDMSNAQVSLLNVLPEVAYGYSSASGDVTLKSSAERQTITLKTSSEEGTTACCIIPAQTFNTTDCVFRIALEDGYTTFTVGLNEAKTLEAGHAYTFNIKINHKIATVSSTEVTDWIEEDAIDLTI